MDEAERSENEQLTPPDGANLWFRWTRVSLVRGQLVWDYLFHAPERDEILVGWAQFGLN
jgi:hypothetical protein